MTDEEIQGVATQILRERLGAFGFQDADAHSEIDFDGSPVIRVKARYADEHAPAAAITQSLNDIRSALIRGGEERFVLLEGELLGNEQLDEDVD
jgi:hypothetical protein